MMTFVVAPASDHASGLNLEGLVDYINKKTNFKIVENLWKKQLQKL